MSTLIVSLPVEPATSATEWAYVVTDDGRAVNQQGRAPAALLPVPRGPGAEVVALVPSQAIAWQLVDLPKGISAGSPRLRAVLADPIMQLDEDPLETYRKQKLYSTREAAAGGDGVAAGGGCGCQ